MKYCVLPLRLKTEPTAFANPELAVIVVGDAGGAVVVAALVVVTAFNVVVAFKVVIAFVVVVADTTAFVVADLT